jgi:hypothetical protein
VEIQLRRTLIHLLPGFVFLVAVMAVAAAQEHAKGVSIHMLPKVVADLSERQCPGKRHLDRYDTSRRIF